VVVGVAVKGTEVVRDPVGGRVRLRATGDTAGERVGLDMTGEPVRSGVGFEVTGNEVGRWVTGLQVVGSEMVGVDDGTVVDATSVVVVVTAVVVVVAASVVVVVTAVVVVDAAAVVVVVTAVAEVVGSEMVGFAVGIKMAPVVVEVVRVWVGGSENTDRSPKHLSGLC
jgi:hypothetical protein